ncbi:MAG: adenylate/guanylate cyclase domain-containing protein [Candidatus Omnitrophota bacterium]|jgi:adenylate cyclase
MIRKVFLISFASLFFTCALLQLTFFSSLKNKLYDSLFHARGILQDKAGVVVIVAIDEASLQKTGDWPWPRSVLAGLIEKIKQGGPKVIGVDLLLDLPTRGKDAHLEDGKLAEVFKVAPTCVLPTVVKEQRSARIQETLFNPLDIFLTDHTVTGVVNVESDPADKITREFKVMYGGTKPSFPLSVCLEYLGCSIKDVKSQGSFIKFADYSIPVRDQRCLINYKCAKVEAFSASDVLEPFFDPVFFFKGKIVLLGRTDLASKDFVNTPVPSGKIFETLSMAGIELWKEIIDMILARNFLYRLPPFLTFLLAVFLSIIICSLTLHSNKGGATLSIVCIGLCGFSFYYLFLKKGIILPLLYLIAVCIISYIFAFLYNFIVFQREKRKITAAFKSYISPHVLANILSQKIDLSVGGKRKVLSMLFADIKGFTSFSDTHGPEEVLNFLKAFFAEMNKAIIEHNGIVNKLMGDGILAFFGDFSDSDTHAYDAVRAAIEMQKKVPDLRKSLGIDFQIRIGVHTGPVDVGNIGSREHLDYTVIGSNVNLAQRLEANCEPGKVLISEATYQMVKDIVEITDMREIPLKGFANTVKVCTVQGLK